MSSNIEGKIYEYEFNDRIFQGFTQKILFDKSDNKKSKIAKLYWEYMKMNIEMFNYDVEKVGNILQNFSHAMRRFAPFYGFNNVNVAFQNSKSQLIENKMKYLEFNKENNALTDLIKNYMVTCVEQNGYFLILDELNNWNMYNEIGFDGKIKSHTILSSEFEDFYGLIDITLGWKKEKELKKNGINPIKSYVLPKDEFKRKYVLSNIN